jgi:hypothetical protein
MHGVKLDPKEATRKYCVASWSSETLFIPTGLSDRQLLLCNYTEKDNAAN